MPNGEIKHRSPTHPPSTTYLHNSGFALAVRLSTGPRRETVVQRALKKEISFNFMKEIPLKKVDKNIEIAFKFT